MLRQLDMMVDISNLLNLN